MSIENGNLVIRHNTNLTSSPIFVYTVTSGQTAEICAGSDMLSFYSASEQIIWNNGVGGGIGIDARLLDNGQVIVQSRGLNSSYQLIGTLANCYTSTTITTTTSTTTSSIFSIPCIGDTLYIGQCLYPGQALCSKTGCYKAIIENGDLVVYRISDMIIAWRSPYTNGRATRACATNSSYFDISPHTIGLSGPSNAQLTNDGQLFFLLQSTGQRNLGNLGIGSSCFSNFICAQSVIDVGECLTPGQFKVSCNECFKMVLEGGNLVVYYNNALGLPPVWTYQSTSGQAAKACGEVGSFQFYSSSGSHVWGEGPSSDGNGVTAKILDNGQIVFAAKNSSISYVFTYGNASSCYTPTTQVTTTTGKIN